MIFHNETTPILVTERIYILLWQSIQQKATRRATKFVVYEIIVSFVIVATCSLIMILPENKRVHRL